MKRIIKTIVFVLVICTIAVICIYEASNRYKNKQEALGLYDSARGEAENVTLLGSDGQVLRVDDSANTTEAIEDVDSSVGFTNEEYTEEIIEEPEAPTTEELTTEAPTTEEPTTEAPTESNNYEPIYVLDEYKDDAFRIVADMSTDEKLKQMLLVCAHKDAEAKAAAADHVGGVVLFNDSFKMKEAGAVRDLTRALKKNAKIPMLIAVDEEGGEVVRASTNHLLRSKPFPSSQSLYANGGYDAIYEDAKEKCDFLTELGLNVNLGPVADVSTNSEDYIYKRSFGQGAEETSEYVRQVTSAMNEKKVGYCLKHFPGYGSNTDTHEDGSVDMRAQKVFYESDFLPFRAGIENRAAAILVNHNIVCCFDDKNPASISPEVHRILREELGFNGVIITDDLDMKGIRNDLTVDEIVVRAVKSGNDMLCCTYYQEYYQALKTALENGDIKEFEVDAAVAKIIAWKLSLGMKF